MPNYGAAQFSGNQYQESGPVSNCADAVSVPETTATRVDDATDLILAAVDLLLMLFQVLGAGRRQGHADGLTPGVDGRGGRSHRDVARVRQLGGRQPVRSAAV